MQKKYLKVGHFTKMTDFLSRGILTMKNTSNQTKYKLLAPAYDLFMGNRFFLNARKKAFENIQFKGNDRVLLAGVGTGKTSVCFQTI
ncbi:hypothetical protein [Halobacillus amylolyticus]|uniref:Uncharacterized protein n=1 Tax=Halobacillus amylolyticus TaxID=2932259 RepID=A0ABY4HBQ5_9BACI|nr:hypothetical protein [Halobacillus amylolyticus]UOR12107.1 hypothetical protein MUO15_00745 [Halobacillus amylolyticus]